MLPEVQTPRLNVRKNRAGAKIKTKNQNPKSRRFSLCGWGNLTSGIVCLEHTESVREIGIKRKSFTKTQRWRASNVGYVCFEHMENVRNAGINGSRSRKHNVGARPTVALFPLNKRKTFAKLKQTEIVHEKRTLARVHRWCCLFPRIESVLEHETNGTPVLYGSLTDLVLVSY